MSMFKKGFTLAEVLITLLIIGVIASIVLPGLIANTQMAEYKIAWKKIFADINQAYYMINMDNNGTFAGAATNSSSFRNLFKNKMNFVTTCDDTSCAASSVKGLNGSADTTYSFNYNLVLNNGTIMSIFALDNPSCTNSGYVSSMGKECGWMMVDVNGKKSPNQWGKDIYGIWVLNNEILPWGANPEGTANNSWVESTCTTTGYGCGSKYLYN